ncbi:hypothetical protein A1O1_07720 [Capronia coronata CBS 617.96]|uniref:Azaphilone pigments biosynthesis cluster protein L N-terminal domain-containing protein n=1 Tax=Capronia coronata CBS 617.96 TaxID=1182541 RepID=W9XWB7_9EURO|nr:uncharacterized protein A1O1_07567 [Capronia coronata CBS 617.96]XP_007726776.1 uncharacterized protein A1O1_07720 [Capronia coronata CBS 617.96]EXJ81503.1 hypothetical protein A1O1_07567 [Capronia coronata CBS 617.96]EXJ81655.1 hypothetical protein A1O1_07720 [Capronia coronata CBS 617.96]
MAGVGEAASILALATFAYDTSKKLYEVVSSFKSRRTDIQEVQSSLTALVSVLELVQQQILESGDECKYKPLCQPMQCCISTCEDMQKSLDACTQRPNDVHASIRDWLKMQFHGKSFADMKQRLASYQSTLSIAFASVNL